MSQTHSRRSAQGKRGSPNTHLSSPPTTASPPHPDATAVSLYKRINAFGNEDKTHLSDSLLASLVRQHEPFTALKHLVREVHFNTLLPQNMNVVMVVAEDSDASEESSASATRVEMSSTSAYGHRHRGTVTQQRHSRLQVFDGRVWNLVDKEDAVVQMADVLADDLLAYIQRSGAWRAEEYETELTGGVGYAVDLIAELIELVEEHEYVVRNVHGHKYCGSCDMDDH
jgi:hypothetical protein